MASHTNLSSLYPAQQKRLHAFRRVAADLYRLLGQKIGAKLTVGSKEKSLLSEADMRLAATPIRMTLLQRESANLIEVIAALRLLKDPGLDPILAEVEHYWGKAEQGQIHFYTPAGAAGGKSIRDAFLYGTVTHDGDNWAEINRLLADAGELGVFALQTTMLQHARLIIRLDVLIADVLGEPRVWEDPAVLEERFF